jgi:hypothetical protein
MGCKPPEHELKDRAGWGRVPPAAHVAGARLAAVSMAHPKHPPWLPATVLS